MGHGREIEPIVTSLRLMQSGPRLSTVFATTQVSEFRGTCFLTHSNTG